jgi:guanylate kinase
MVVDLLNEEECKDKVLVGDEHGIQLSISYTTRKSREAEVEGKDYYFTDEKQFQQMVKQQAFLEHAHVYGNYYGTSVEKLNEKLNAGIDVILEIDWQGADQVRKRINNSRSIFILPPSVDALRERLESRGQDSQQIIDGRMETAIKEMMHYYNFDYLVINDQFENALNDLKSIVRENQLQTNHQRLNNNEIIKNLGI